MLRLVFISQYNLDIDNDDYSQFIDDTSQIPMIGQNGEIIIEEEDNEETTN